MYEEFCSQQRKRADAHLAAFLETNRDYSVASAEPRWLKGTHLVTFGEHRGRPVVFKFYDGDPRKGHEQKALRLYEPTGLVPRILGETEVMLVMERLPGATLHEMKHSLTEAEWAALHCRLGEAVAKVVSTVPRGGFSGRHRTSFRAADSRDFYSTPYEALMELYRQADAADFFDITLDRAARVLRDRDVPRKETLAGSLAALTRNRDAILAYPQFVAMDDFHTNNIMAAGSRITGFIDLEMTRTGNEVLLLGAALWSMCRQPESWHAFRRGYEEARGATMNDRTVSLVRSAAPFSTWIRFTWYWSIDDLPWWAREGDLRSSTVRAIAGGIEAIDEIQP